MAVARTSRRIAAPAPVIIDAGPLIALAKTGRIGVLKSLFGRVHVTPEVIAELALQSRMPGVKEIRAGLRAGWLVRQRSPDDAEPHPFLDAGEASCIATASRHADALLVIDEQLGRQEARRMGIAITGTAGVLCAAKAQGMIDAVVPILEQMRASGYFLGDRVIEAARRQARE